MNFWRKVQRFFGATGPFEAELRSALRRQLKARRHFTRKQLVRDAIGKDAAREDRDAALATLDEVLDSGVLEGDRYTRSLVKTDTGKKWIFHPADDPPEAPARAQSTTGAAAPKAAAAPAAAPAPKRAKPHNPYDASAILQLSPKEMRARALKIDPHKTAWIFRTDTIPPQSDERTALIDRGLILRGLLKEEQIAEIHRVGDLWLEHRDAERLARTRAAASVEAALAELRERAKRAKEEKKRAAAERRERRAVDVARRRAEDIMFLGRGVSRALGDRRSNVERLQAARLPVLATPADVAKALGLRVPELRWLCFHSDAAEKIHYVQFEVPKRSGGVRLLSAPMPKLAAAQRWLLSEVLAKVPLEEPAHGFVPGRSTVTNALPHRGRDVVVNLDLQDFFPSIVLSRVRGLFVKLGYSPAVATIFALLATEAPRRAVEYDGQKYWVALGPRGLPQGACTSPALSNVIARRLDRRLTGLAHKHGLVYTRYADDLTFSLAAERRGDVAFMLARIRHVIQDEGFTIQLKKGRVQRAGGRQLVTGLVVNHPKKVSLPRDEIRKLRALLHNAKKTGLAAQNRDGHADFRAHLRGKIAYLHMVDPAKAAPLRAALAEVK